MSYKTNIKMLRWGLIPNQPSFNIFVDQEVGLAKSLRVVQIQQDLLEHQMALLLYGRLIQSCQMKLCILFQIIKTIM